MILLFGAGLPPPPIDQLAVIVKLIKLGDSPASNQELGGKPMLPRFWQFGLGFHLTPVKSPHLSAFCQEGSGKVEELGFTAT